MGLFSKKENTELFELLANSNKTDDTNTSATELPRHSLTAEEVVSENRPFTAESSPKESPLAALQRRMAQASAQQEPPAERNDIPMSAPVPEPIQTDMEKSPEHESLLERCKAYTTDSSGHSVLENEPPLYTLESVGDILKDDSRRTLELLKEKYGFSVSQKEAERVSEQTVSPTVSRETPQAEPIPPVASVKTVQEISDLDPLSSIPTVPDAADTGNTATIRFTPIRSEHSQTDEIRISTQTRPLDLTGEISSLPTPESAEEPSQLAESEFETFTEKDEPKDLAAAKVLARKFAVKKRQSFLQTIFSFLILLGIAAFYLPNFSGFLLSSPKKGMLIGSSILLCGILINYDLFFSLPNLFSKRAKADGNILLATAAVTVCGFVAAVNGQAFLSLLLLGAVLLLLRAVSSFMTHSALYGNLRQIIRPHPQKAVALIDDPSVTFAMAKSSIEGSVLAAAPQSAEFVEGFLKYNRFSMLQNGRQWLITVFSLLIAVISGFVCAATSHRIADGFYMASAVLCLTAMPPLMFSETLPNFSAARRMNKKGSMIAGITGAEHLEQANAVVLSTKDIFPSGSVTLHDLKVLSESDFDRIIVRAASLTEAVGSPLAPIFKRIAGTDESYEIPNSDSFKYEKDLGISGWVDDEILFIGNRTIMEAHGIAVPPLETDRKILHNGFFPVYLAYGGKACALLSVQYAVDPTASRLLHRITELGVTLLLRNCDPNLTEEMICDYFGLYEDSVKIMSNAGVNMCRMATAKTDRLFSPALFRGNPLNFIALMCCASRVKQSNRLLSVFYIIAVCLGVMTFLYLSFSGIGSMPNADVLLLYEITVTVLGYIVYFCKHP